MIEIRLTRGKIALVDDIDGDLAELNWYAHYSPSYDAYYAARSIPTPNGQRIESLHRVIMGRIMGRELLTKELVDHIHHITLDNRRSELRLASHAENVRNRKMGKNNTSGYKGVMWSKEKQHWYAQIKVNGVKHYLGAFDDAIAAAIAYDEAALLYHGEFAYINFSS